MSDKEPREYGCIHVVLGLVVFFILLEPFVYCVVATPTLLGHAVGEFERAKKEAMEEE